MRLGFHVKHMTLLILQRDISDVLRAIIAHDLLALFVIKHFRAFLKKSLMTFSHVDRLLTLSARKVRALCVCDVNKRIDKSIPFLTVKITNPKKKSNEFPLYT